MKKKNEGNHENQGLGFPGVHTRGKGGNIRG